MNTLYFILISVLIASCDNDNQLDLTELKQNKQKWLNQQFSDYQFNFSWVCFCPNYTVKIDVKNEKIDTVIAIPTKNKISLDAFYSIRELFDWLEDQYELNPVSHEVTYHSQYGYPIRAQFDYEAHIADEEMGFVIDTLVVK